MVTIVLTLHDVYDRADPRARAVIEAVEFEAEEWAERVGLDVPELQVRTSE